RSYAKGEPIDAATVGAEAVDDHTFRVTLTNPLPYLLELAAFPPFYPRHERSMAPFRVFSDSNDQQTDVMDVFERFVVAAQHVERSKGSADEVAAKFQAAAGVNGRKLDPAAVTAWLDVAKGVDIRTKTQSELLDALAVFAKMDPLAGIPAPAPSAAPQ